MPPVTPLPIACQLTPSHIATLFVPVTPPAFRKTPPTISSPFHTVMPTTYEPSTPLPSACHDAPSHAAMLDADEPPAVRNEPPAISWPLYTVRQRMYVAVPTPLPSAYQFVPFQPAM